MHPRIGERLGDPAQGIGAGKAQPEFIVESKRERRVEASDVFEGLAAAKAGRLAEEAFALEQSAVEIADRIGRKARAVFVDPPGVAVDAGGFGIFAQATDSGGNRAGVVQIVGVEETENFPFTEREPAIDGVGRSAFNASCDRLVCAATPQLIRRTHHTTSRGRV